MIARTPHPVFAALWLAWSCLMLVCLWWNGWTADLTLWGSFAALEGLGVALNTGKRDTLSEVATWVHRKLSKTRVPYRGWNALLFTPYVGLIGLNVWQMFEGYGAAMEGVGAAVACSLSAGLWDHWISPEVVG